MTWLFPILLFAMPIDDPASVEITVPIDARGDVDLGVLVTCLAESTGMPLPGPAPSLPVPARGAGGSLTRSALAEALGGEVAIRVERDAMRVIWKSDTGYQEAIRTLAEKIGGEAAVGKRFYGMKARPSYRPNDLSRPTVLLLHGMNSASGCFVHMVPILERAGFGVVFYDFPDNRDLDDTCPRFAADLAAFREANGEKVRWSVVAHSMGGLVARWHVEGPSFADDVDRLILIAPPNDGSALAKAQSFLQWFESVSPKRSGRSGGLLELSEGLGAAAEDLAPRSRFLRALNARPRREGVEYRILAGDVGFLGRDARREIQQAFEEMRRSAGLLGRIAAMATVDIPAVLELMSDGTGDGAVSVEATRLAGAPEPVVIHANHVELIRGPLLYPNPGPVACMPQVLEWLGKPRTSE